MIAAEKAWGVEIPGGWFDDKIHCYRDERGTIVPSVTQVFDLLGFTDFSQVNQETLEWKREYGNSVHKGVELLVQRDLDWDSVDERVIPAIAGVEQRLKEMQFQSAACEERRVYSLFGMRYGGSLDHRGTCIHQGVERNCVIDLKTAAAVSPTWKWQVSGYTAGLEKTAKPWLGIVLQVNKDGKVTPHFYDTYAGLREFQTLLAACLIGINAGVYKLDKI